MILVKKLKLYGELVMFSHTLFSLPFALIAMLWAAEGLPNDKTVLWVLIALIAGRNGANAFNRWVDQKIDALNPRTATRHLPQGRVRSVEVFYLAIGLFIIFETAAYKLNTLCFILSPLALILFIVYSYTKRFTWLCHMVLGITCAGAPFGTWIAITGKISMTPLILGLIVMLWVSGFDIIYGTQDIHFDRKHGIYSIPAKFGLEKSLNIARWLHVLMMILLLSLFFLNQLGGFYLVGLFISNVLLFFEHYMVDPKNKDKMSFASYRLNQYISMTILIFTYLDFYVR